MAALCRRAAMRKAARDAGLPLWSADLATYRGRCLRRRCGGRWAVARVSLDFRDAERVDRLATLECATCGRTWRRIAVPPLRSAAGYQSVRLTLIIPGGHVARWYSRGTWHREGDDAQLLRDADLGDLDEAARAHRARQDARLDRLARTREKRAKAEREAAAELMATIARIDARRAAEAEAEAEAATREAAYA